MSSHFITGGVAAGAVMLLLAGPAFANCQQEVRNLEETVIAAETGAAVDRFGLPATKHQRQVLSGARDGKDETVTGSVGPKEPASPHQEQTAREAKQRSERGVEEDVSKLVAEAETLAASGDEQGCRQKVAQAKRLLGSE